MWEEKRHQCRFIPGPRLLVSDPRSVSDWRLAAGRLQPYLWMPKGAQLGDGPVATAQITLHQLGERSGLIKVYMTHRSLVTGRATGFSAHADGEELRPCVRSQRASIRKLLARLIADLPASAFDFGCDSIEHGLSLDERPSRRC